MFNLFHSFYQNPANKFLSRTKAQKGKHFWVKNARAQPNPSCHHPTRFQQKFFTQETSQDTTSHARFPHRTSLLQFFFVPDAQNLMSLSY